MVITTLEQALNYKVSDIAIDEKWNIGDEKELKIHSVHAYPAKFPAFIATKAIKYAKDKGVDVKSMADIFCGCGTVAIEAKMNNIDFWGCDINPVATLIAKVKSSNYNMIKINNIYKDILEKVSKTKTKSSEYNNANERLQYWFEEKQFLDLLKYHKAIENMSSKKYKDFFRCVFSSSLKPTSKWLTKSIKPQIDPDKDVVSASVIFEKQYNKFIKAYNQNANINSSSKINIETANFLRKRILPTVDLIVTSPPYVTSYEYADLHQLSSLWLGYTEDYRNLRNGSIGSIHNSVDYYFEVMNLNETARKIVAELREQKAIQNAKIQAVARYYIDMQKTVDKCFNMLNNNGIALFVVGDTEYKQVKIENARHLVESLISAGFNEVNIVKRKITNKLLTPYRDENGKFSSDKSNRTIYHEEFVIIGRKDNE